MGEGLADVEITGGGVFGTLHDLKDMAPRQLRNRLLRNWAIRELSGKYLHREQITNGQAAHVRELLLEVGGEAVDNFGSPDGFPLAGENNFPGLPVGLDYDGVGSEDRPDAGTAEVGLNLLERGGVGLG
jgi:hypothetical protein